MLTNNYSRKGCYLRADIRRLLKSPRFPMAILGVAMMLLFSLESELFEIGTLITDVTSMYMDSISMSAYIVAFSFCALPFALVYTEDWEHKYIRYGWIRGGLMRFVLSKMAVIYMSALFTMTLGTMVFVLIGRIWLPWMSVNGADGGMLDILKAGNYGYLARQEHFFRYIMLNALHMGLKAGFLANMAAFCSVIISNTALTLLFPVLAECMLGYINIKGHGISSFGIIGTIFGTGWIDSLFLMMVSVAISLLSALGCYCVLKRKI